MNTRHGILCNDTQRDAKFHGDSNKEVRMLTPGMSHTREHVANGGGRLGTIRCVPPQHTANRAHGYEACGACVPRRELPPSGMSSCESEAGFPVVAWDAFPGATLRRCAEEADARSCARQGRFSPMRRTQTTRILSKRTDLV